MTKRAFDKIAAGLNDAVAIVEGRADPAAYRAHVPADIDVKALRQELDMTQAEFAARFGFSKAAVADWEQRRRKPEASARVLLTVIRHNPKAVLDALDKQAAA
jgi:putative transcriptional regulator